jgi:biotin carboxyl carrier protein
VEGIRSEKLELKLEARIGEETFHLVIREWTGEGGCKQLEVTLANSEDERNYRVEILGHHRDRWTLKLDRFIEDFVVFRNDRETLVEWNKKLFPIEISSRREMYLRQIGHDLTQGETSVRAQMPGKIIRIMKTAGDPVDEGEAVLVVEAMKMQNEIESPVRGRILSLDLKEGDGVGALDTLFTVVGQTD